MSRSLLDLRDAGVLSGHQWKPVHLPELSGEPPLPLQTPVPQRYGTWGLQLGSLSMVSCEICYVNIKGIVDCFLFTFQHRGLFQDHVILHAIAVLMLIAFSHSLSDNSCCSDLPVCLAGAPGCMGFPDLEAEGGEAAEWLLLPGDSVCLRLLPLHLHPHLSESADTLVNVWVVFS